ncbi:MAG: nitrogenase [Planctomycetes bacterium]|nr:nitrogenase [Planctomycetota bacterium]
MNGSDSDTRPSCTAARNACKLCTPLGACLAFAGIEGARTLLHGSQGCATYIRRYMISHFKEPVDIASSNFGEISAIFGGRDNLRIALENVSRQYQPRLIGVATTCLAETIGDDVAMFLREIRHESPPTGDSPLIVNVSTPSYSGTHADGFYAAVRASVESIAEGGETGNHVNVFPGMFSPADLRYLREVFRDFEIDATILPDYSDTLDGPTWDEYQLIPQGGTPVAQIRAAGRARASLEFAATNDARQTAATWLSATFGIASHRLPPPIGVAATDAWFGVLEALRGAEMPARHRQERGRLIDSFVDGHKYVFGRRAVVYGEEDLVVGIASLLAEIGVIPVLCASGGESGRLRSALQANMPTWNDQIQVVEGVDFADLGEMASQRQPDLLIGSSKGYSLSRELGIPLIRVGFPIHDRVGGSRILHIGYRGAQQLFDRIVNAVMESAQDDSPVGYAYM